MYPLMVGADMCLVVPARSFIDAFCVGSGSLLAPGVPAVLHRRGGS